MLGSGRSPAIIGFKNVPLPKSAVRCPSTPCPHCGRRFTQLLTAGTADAVALEAGERNAKGDTAAPAIQALKSFLRVVSSMGITLSTGAYAGGIAPSTEG